MRHKRILNLAEAEPDASLEEIANEVPTATIELVENVLEKYGDPANDGADSEADEASDYKPEDGATNVEMLTDQQRETLEAIFESPEATQREIAERLEVSPATVSTRVNGIAGFEWDERGEFAASLFGTSTTGRTDPEMSTDDADVNGKIERLSERITDVERALKQIQLTTDNPVAFTDPELAHKVVHASMESDLVSEEEELRIIREILK